MKNCLIILFSLFASNLFAQKKGYVFIEAAPNLPYEVILDNSIANESNGTDFLVIPQVAPGTHTLGFKLNGSKEVNKKIIIDVLEEKGTIIKLAPDGSEVEVNYHNDTYMSIVTKGTIVEDANSKVISNAAKLELQAQTDKTPTVKAQELSKPLPVSIDKTNTTRTDNTSNAKNLDVKGWLKKQGEKSKKLATNVRENVSEKIEALKTERSITSSSPSENIEAPVEKISEAEAQARYLQMVASLVGNNDNTVINTNAVAAKNKEDKTSKLQIPTTAPLSKLARKQAAEVAKREAKKLQDASKEITMVDDKFTEKPKNQSKSAMEANNIAKNNLDQKEADKTNKALLRKQEAELKAEAKKKKQEAIELAKKESIAKSAKEDEIAKQNKDAKKAAKANKALLRQQEADLKAEAKRKKQEALDLVKMESKSKPTTNTEASPKNKPKEADQSITNKELAQDAKVDNTDNNVLSDLSSEIKKKPKAIKNTNCKGLANEAELVELFQKLEAKVDDDARISVIRKTIAKNRNCYTCKDVEQLSQSFNTQSGKYDFIKQLFPYLKDEENVKILANIFKYDTYKKKVQMEFGIQE